MPRKPKATASTSTKSELGLSDLRLRLNFLEKENDKLIKQIESSRTKLDKLNESIQKVGVEIAERVAPLRQKVLEIDQQIHDLFKEIFEGRKLGKKSRKDIQEVYYSLQLGGLISPKHLPFDELEMDGDEDEDEDEWQEYQQRFHGQRDRGNKQPEELAKPDREELKKIRQLFLRLADNFHPDKVTDAAEKEYRTEIMKEINLAYQNGDLARLLAIEKQQELEAVIDRDSSDDLTRHCAKVESENAFLKEQLATLKKQLKVTQKSQQGEITATFQKITKYGGDPMSEALMEVESHIEMIEGIQKFVLDFRDRRITIKEFLRGPEVLRQAQMSEEEMLMRFLSQFQ